MALLIAVVSSLTATCAVVMGLRGRMRRDRVALQWVASVIFLRH
jgi:hypothetical protein